MTATDAPQLDFPISRLRSGDAPRWAGFVTNSANGTVFHRLDFLGYHEKGRFDWHHLVLGNAGTPTALLPAAVVQDDLKRCVLRSPAGATFGGLVIPPRLGLQHTVELVRSLVEYSRHQCFDEIAIGTVPWIYWKQPDDSLEFALRSAGFQHTVQLCHYVDLADAPRQDKLDSISGRRRTRFRKALKQGMQFSEATTPQQIAEFYEVLLANKRQHNSRPGHSLDELILLKKHLGGELRIYTALKDQRMVAGVYCVAANARVGYTQYIADDPRYRDLEATRFLIFQMISELSQRGFKYLDLGPSALLPIEKLSLARFKESFGAVGCHRTEWRLCLSTEPQKRVA